MKRNTTSLPVKSTSSSCLFLTLFLLSLKSSQAFTSPTTYISNIHIEGESTRASLLPSSSSYQRRYSGKASSSRLHFFQRDKSESVIEEPSTFQEEQQQNTMGDLVQFLKPDSESKEDNTVMLTQKESYESPEKSLGIPGNTLTIAALSLLSIGIATITQMDMTETLTQVQAFFADPQATLEAVVNSVQEMGPNGYLYFGVVYTVAEILAIPAIPLTASAGYLFGVRNGTIVVLMAASIAASVSFLIGRTFLRTYVENLLKKYPEFQKIDRAIGEEGFKIMLLLRLSPIFPFALSNYLYGVTSIDFWSYFFGTMLGFTPGTIAYVFTGEIGKNLTLDSASAEPWYVYAGVLAVLSGFIKIASDVATNIIENVQAESEEMDVNMEKNKI
ncbi:hypothetical protein CTEN210_00881 [Chaetoceros tenuissimus]|uniref:VTT domain-containing protein n=1 Tax=Chaetoceros tenuissimus TaxID=426638 RepID=A0AAD3CE29_9STRA|nr:hypothetical protein CTEN210_00881 [Chaetoceros tenuissimus]